MLSLVMMAALEIVQINGQVHHCEPGTSQTLAMIDSQIDRNRAQRRRGHTRQGQGRILRENNQLLREVKNRVQHVQCMDDRTYRDNLRADRQERRRAERLAQERAQHRQHQSRLRRQARLQDFTNMLKQESFDSHKLRLIKNALPQNCLYTTDVEMILRTFDFDSYRQRALKLMANQIIDKENRFVLRDEFSFASYGNRAMETVADARRGQCA